MNKNINKLNAIIIYCDKTKDVMEEYGKDIEDFLESIAYQERCSFYLLQIGENVRTLSEELKKGYPETEWDNIRKIRNEIAHTYNWVDKELMWSTITEKLPKLKETCKNILYELERH